MKNASDGLIQRKREERTKEIFEVMMADNFPKLLTDIKPPIQEAQRTPNMINTKSTPRHIIFKLQKTRDKEKILKEGRREKTPYQYKKKAKNYIGFLSTNHASEKRVQ